jgi:hypothetical protein
LGHFGSLTLGCSEREIYLFVLPLL